MNGTFVMLGLEPQMDIVSPYENIPLDDESVDAIFYYTPHGLKNHDLAIHEANRILKPGGRMLILL